MDEMDECVNARVTSERDARSRVRVTDDASTIGARRRTTREVRW